MACPKLGMNRFFALSVFAIWVCVSCSFQFYYVKLHSVILKVCLYFYSLNMCTPEMENYNFSALKWISLVVIKIILIVSLSLCLSSVSCSASSSSRCRQVVWSSRSSTAWSTSSTVTSSHNTVGKHALQPSKGHRDSEACDDANHARHTGRCLCICSAVAVFTRI